MSTESAEVNIGVALCELLGLNPRDVAEISMVTCPGGKRLDVRVILYAQLPALSVIKRFQIGQLSDEATPLLQRSGGGGGERSGGGFRAGWGPGRTTMGEKSE